MARRIVTPGTDVVPTIPAGRCHVLKGVPFDNSYTDTLIFSSKAAQLAVMLTYTKVSRDDFTPVRMQNKIAFPCCADEIYDCNYIMWNNIVYGSKWFYAFIIAVDYVNPNVCHITYEIDVLQTWAFDYTLNTCYIEREHTETDVVGEHCLIEGVNPGQYVEEPQLVDTDLNDLEAVVIYAENTTASYPILPTGEPSGLDSSVEPRAVGKMQGGMFNSVQYKHGMVRQGSASLGALGDFLETLINTGKAGNVVATYTMPSYFYTEDEGVKIKTFDVPKDENQVALGTYIPRNKKCLVWPYNMLRVTNGSGSYRDLRWEYFKSTGTAKFYTVCAMGQNPEVWAYPMQYNGQDMNQDEALTLTGYPQFGFVCDTYKAYMAQNASQMAFNTVLNGASMGAGVAQMASAAAGTGAIGAAGAGAGLIANSLISMVQMHINRGKMELEPNQMVGCTNCGTPATVGKLNFFYKVRHIREDYAKCLDDYFDMFGYLVNRLGVPNLFSRPSWNYIKTVDCSATGDVPFGDMKKIKEIYNNGIRFWHKTDIGNYQLDNRV